MIQSCARRGASVLWLKRQQLLAQVSGLWKTGPWLAIKVDFGMLQLVVDRVHGGTTAAGIPQLLAKNLLVKGHVASHQYVQNHTHTPKIRRWRIVAL
eukprot:Skav220024  [mRNA]  locus=scaffold2981:72288:81623:- [translate_table: standard]